MKIQKWVLVSVLLGLCGCQSADFASLSPEHQNSFQQSLVDCITLDLKDAMGWAELTEHTGLDLPICETVFPHYEQLTKVGSLPEANPKELLDPSCLGREWCDQIDQEKWLHHERFLQHYLQTIP